jgi:phenylalanyl-tRNA synthetase beta subunit
LIPVCSKSWRPQRVTINALGLIEIDLDVLSNPDLVARRDEVVAIVSRFPDATIDLAFVTPDDVNAGDLAHHLRLIDSLVTMVTLFDVFRG